MSAIGENTTSCFQMLQKPKLVLKTVEVKSEAEKKLDAAKRLKETKDPVEKLRLLCLQRSCADIKGLAKSFRIIDIDGSRKLDRFEFEKGLHKYGIFLNTEEIERLFIQLDRDSSEMIDFDDFLLALRPTMSRSRQNIIEQAFDRMDKSINGSVILKDMIGSYNVKNHSKFITGEMTKEQIFKDFLKTFEIGDHNDGIVTKEEFLNYYAGLNASIDDDMYFDLMIRNTWNLT